MKPTKKTHAHRAAKRQERFDFPSLMKRVVKGLNTFKHEMSIPTMEEIVALKHRAARLEKRISLIGGETSR